MNTHVDADVLERTRKAVEEFPLSADGSFSNGARRALHRFGLLALTIPREYGGFGADSLAQSKALWVISKGCPSVGLWYAMHTTVMMFIAALGTDEQKKKLFEKVVREGNLFAAATSEPGASFQDAFEMRTTFTPVDGGYRVDGEKHFCSIGRWAQRYFVMGKRKGSTTAKEGAITAAIQRGPGIDIVVWDFKKPIGMRETSSDSIGFKGVFVPSSDVIGNPGQLFASGLFANFAICYATVYGTIGEKAIEFTEAYLKEKKLSPERVAKNQQVLKRARRRVGGVRFRISEACNAFSQDRANAVLPIARAKLAACNTSTQVVQDMMQLVGGSSIFEATCPLGEMARCALVGRVMPPSQTRCLEVIARIERGEKGVTLLEFL